MELEVIDIYDRLFSLINRLDYITMANQSYVIELADSPSVAVQNELSGFRDINYQLVNDFRAFLLGLDPHIKTLQLVRANS